MGVRRAEVGGRRDVSEGRSTALHTMRSRSRSLRLALSVFKISFEQAKRAGVLLGD